MISYRTRAELKDDLKLVKRIRMAIVEAALSRASANKDAAGKKQYLDSLTQLLPPDVDLFLNKLFTRAGEKLTAFNTNSADSQQEAEADAVLLELVGGSMDTDLSAIE